jgi:hypothetical protein
VRVASVRAGRISLALHEAAAGERFGGHTIARHVGKRTSGASGQPECEESTRRTGCPAASNVQWASVLHSDRIPDLG